MYIKIIIFSMLPITELRLSIPYFVIFEKLDWMMVVMLSVIGNIFIGFTIFYLIAPIMIFLSKNRYFKNIINYILDRTRSKSSLINNFKALGLVLFIGIPLPFTGVWTGSLAAYLFSISKKRVIAAIVMGVLMSATIVTLLTLLANEIWLNIINDQLNKKFGIFQ